jgi:predicted PurR-regulated permease PerM
MEPLAFTHRTEPSGARRCEVVAWVLAALGLVAVLHLHLLAALLAGLLVFELVESAAAGLRRAGLRHSTGRIAALVILWLFIAALLLLAVLGLLGLVNDRSESLPLLMEKMADEVDSFRSHLPDQAQAYLPANAEELENAAAGWLRAHAGALQAAGAQVLRMFVQILVGMVIGGMIALADYTRPQQLAPLTAALAVRVTLLAHAFRRVVFAQLRISAFNTALTAIYLALVLPALGIHLPLIKTMIAVTFVVGLLPVLGNLISNTVIVVVSLSASAYAAAGSLIFLVLIHKLEYFVNARIIGGQIRARAWELLLAMLVMDAAFGIPGVIAAPIYYAYLKDELSGRQLI